MRRMVTGMAVQNTSLAALTIADSIYTYIAMRTDGAKSLQIEKSMESLKY